MILLCWYKRCNVCLISFFSLYGLFLAFICANKTESLHNSLLGVKNFNPVPVPCVFLFQGINFTVSAIVSSGCDFKYWSSVSLSDFLHTECLLSSS